MTAVLADTPVATRSGSAPPPLRLVVRAAPRREPPFDDELADGPMPGRHDQRLPFERAPAPRAAAYSVARPNGLPEPAAWGRRLLVGLIETADGRRPLQQLAALLSPSVGQGLGSDFDRAAAIGQPHWLHRAGVHSVRFSEPAVGVAELCATVATGRRVRAIAMRLEAHHGRWRCTRLQLG